MLCMCCIRFFWSWTVLVQSRVLFRCGPSQSRFGWAAGGLCQCCTTMMVRISSCCWMVPRASLVLSKGHGIGMPGPCRETFQSAHQLKLTQIHLHHLKPKSEFHTCRMRTGAQEVPRCERRTCNMLQHFVDVLFNQFLFTVSPDMSWWPRWCWCTRTKHPTSTHTLPRRDFCEFQTHKAHGMSPWRCQVRGTSPVRQEGCRPQAPQAQRCRPFDLPGLCGPRGLPALCQYHLAARRTWSWRHPVHSTHVLASGIPASHTGVIRSLYVIEWYWIYLILNWYVKYILTYWSMNNDTMISQSMSQFTSSRGKWMKVTDATGSSFCPFPSSSCSPSSSCEVNSKGRNLAVNIWNFACMLGNYPQMVLFQGCGEGAFQREDQWSYFSFVGEVDSFFYCQIYVEWTACKDK